MSNDVFISLATNLGLLSICAILVTIISLFMTSWFPDFSKDVIERKRPLFGGLVGIAFGLTCAALILSAHKFQTGSVLDSRAGPAILSGLVGGPVAALITFVIGGAARAWVGGAYVVGGVTSVGVYIFSGLALAHLFKINIRQNTWSSYLALVPVSIVCTIAVAPCFFMQGDFATSYAVAAALMPILLIQNPVSVLLLGGVLKLMFMVIDDRERLNRLTAQLDDANQKLNATNDCLSASNKKLTDFSAIVAHDLKAPLRAIGVLIGYIVQDMKDLKLDPSEELMENVDFLEQKLGAMNVLVDDLVSYTVGTGRAADAQAFDPNERMLDVMSQIGVREGFNIKLNTPFPQCYAPPAAFDIVVRNLISNAIKHHDQSTGSISITARKEEDAVLFEVADDGPGVPTEYLEKIFNPFLKLRSRDEVQGSGLGLSFASKLVESWGGRIFARSEKERGSIFSFTVPLAP